MDMTHVLPVRALSDHGFMSARGDIYFNWCSYSRHMTSLGFKCEDYLVTFRRKGKVSYLREEVEIVKIKGTDLDRTIIVSYSECDYNYNFFYY